MTIVESMVVIGCILTLAIGYTVIYINLYKEAMKQTEVEKEYCPSSEDEE